MSNPTDSNVDLERAVTFTGYEEFQDHEGILDEEQWNWPVLLTRVLCFFLLFVIIVCVALEEISKRFLVLAAVVGGLLVLVLVATYVDPRKWFGILFCRRQQQQPTPAMTYNNSTVSSTGNHVSMANRPLPIPPTVISPAASSISIKNPIQMVDRSSFNSPSNFTGMMSPSNNSQIPAAQARPFSEGGDGLIKEGTVATTTGNKSIQAANASASKRRSL
jgi:hypothetical protein